MKKPFVDCASTGCRLPECVAREVDAIYKTLPQGCTYQTKTVATDLIFEPGERSDVSILTSCAVDKSNEVVIPAGVALDSYRKSMVVLWNHNHERPVARCSWIKLRGDTIRAKTLYPDDGPEFTNEVWSMTKSGILKAKSIGFLPRKPLREPSAEELVTHPEWKGAGVWDDVMLLEYSCCSVGMNHDALVEAVNTKSVNGSVLKSLGVDVPEPVVVPVVVPEPVVKACSCHEEKKPLVHPECVRRHIKSLQAAGNKYSPAQLAAIAYAACGCGRRKKKAIDVNKVLADTLDGITLDAARIVMRAVNSYRDRGRV